MKRLYDDEENIDVPVKSLEAIEKENEELKVEKVREIILMSQAPVSLETPIGEEEDSRLKHFIEDKKQSVEKEVTNILLKEQMQEVLGRLTERERRVLELRFGLEDESGRTLEKIGKEFGLTRERIRQIERTALKKIEIYSRKYDLKDYTSDLD